MPHRFASLFSATSLLAAFAGSAVAQCPNLTWTGHFSAPGLGLTNPAAAALHQFDPDGPGPARTLLFVGGSFTTAGSIASPCIASWSGTQWATVGGGVAHASGHPHIAGLTTHDPDGAGPLPPVLIAAGRFDHAGSTTVQNIAAWDGAAWAPFGGLGSANGTMTFVRFDPDGPGQLPESLYVAGSEGFHVPNSSYTNFARWDGAQWSAVPGAPILIFDLAVFDEDGSGPALPALFAASGYLGSQGLYKWDGAIWTVVGGGLRSGYHLADALLVVDEDGPGPLPTVLLVGGFVTLAGTTPVTNMARWDGESWSDAGQGISGQVEDIIAVDYSNGAGAPTLFAATLAQGVFRRDPGAPAWSRIGTSNGQPGLAVLCSLAAFDDDGAGPLTPAIYYTSIGMTVVNQTPSFGIARYGCNPCYPNCDGSFLSPSLNVNDFICFLNRFAAADPYANCDASTILPNLNVNDFTCFLNRYGAGCP